MEQDLSIISDTSLAISSTPLNTGERRRWSRRICTPTVMKMKAAPTSDMSPITILDLTSDKNDNTDDSIQFIKKVLQRKSPGRRRVIIKSPKATPGRRRFSVKSPKTGKRRSPQIRKRSVKTITKSNPKKKKGNKSTRWGPPIVEVAQPYEFSVDQPAKINFVERSSQCGIGNIFRFTGNNNAATSSVNSRYQLRPISIDGQNVACAHGRQLHPRDREPYFSTIGIDIVVQYFKRRGHEDIKVFLPSYRMRVGKSDHQYILKKLEREGNLVLTPCREIRGSCFTSYDDRYVVQWAASNGGIIVSNDQYRDLLYENVEMTKAIQERLLMFNFVGNMLMFPDDPLGKFGPKLDQLLRF